MPYFPPHTNAYLEGRSAGEPADPYGRPDTRSAARLLVWTIRRQGRLFWLGLLISTVFIVPQSLAPWIFGQAIDLGITAGDNRVTAFWAIVLAVITIIGASTGVLFHTTIVAEWLIALYGTSKLVRNKALQLGHVLPRRTPTGEVLSVSGSDGDEFGALAEILTRAFSQLVGFLFAVVIVVSISPALGLIMLLTAPLLVLAATPLLLPMQRWQTLERNRTSHLTSMATDIVAGLRILRGIGGERTFGDNYTAQSQLVRRAGLRAGAWQAVIEAVGVLLAGIFMLVMLWLGVQRVAAGEITVGDLVTFLGYGLFIVQPLRTFFELAQKTVRALVSARKAVAVLEQDSPWDETAPGTPLPDRAEIVDEASGARIAPGRLTMIVSARPEESAALADRLGRYLPADEDSQVSDDIPESLRGRRARAERSRRQELRLRRRAEDTERARGPWGVRIGGVDLSEVDMDDLRSRVLVSDTAAHVFAGTLQQAIDPHARLTREQAETALHAAAAEDVFEALPGGWQGVLDERGRGLSGGQRQRLILARALAADPDVLVLVEPTSAVDAHTEARIASQLGASRRGRTTVVATASPLLLNRADEVMFLADGRVVAVGRHHDLGASHAEYRNTVLRGQE